MGDDSKQWPWMQVDPAIAAKFWDLVGMEHGLHALREMEADLDPATDFRDDHPTNSARLLEDNVRRLMIELKRHAGGHHITGELLVDHVLATFTATEDEPWLHPFAWRALQLTRWIERHPGQPIAVVRHQVDELSGQYVVTRTIQLGQLDGSRVGERTLPTGPHQRLTLPLSNIDDQASHNMDLWLADDDHTNPLQGLDRPFVIDDDYVVTFGIKKGVPLYRLQILYGEELTRWFIQHDCVSLFTLLHNRLGEQPAVAA